jgi:hypothetical protein
MAKNIRVLSLLVLLLLGATSLISGPRYSSSFEYYTDATYTEMCGWKYVACSYIHREGCVTEFVIVYPEGECGGW